ncbi:MAG: phosphoribosyl-AMP cyclohydrolase [Thermodesulfobacteriota bacterium]|nr:phosphoribosyl-AMP cyclohydrolase [Thermodesulfobacteriota bacterium]
MVEPDFKKGKGLVPVIVQDYKTKDVLMLAYMNEESWLKTLETGKATYWSRSRSTLWVKGETSGNIQLVKDILIDCDSDTVLLRVEQVGGASCHTGYNTCFYRRLSGGKVEVVGKKIFNPEEVYK